MHIVIPCRSLRGGKKRLVPCLDADGRRALCERLLVRTLELAAGMVASDRIRVVSGDADALAIVDRYGMIGLRDASAGLNAALDIARADLLAHDAGADALLALPIDLPYATADALAGAQAHAGEVVIGPDQSGTGTNMLLMRGAALRRLPFCFGPGSYAAHLAAARAHGLTATTFRDRRIAFDIDRPPHYLAWHKDAHADAAP